MAPADRPDLDRLTTAVDTLGAAIASIEHETLDTESLKLASLLVSRAANMLDGCRADLARRSRNLTPPGTPPPHHTLDPHHQRTGNIIERDSARADLFDTYTELGDATRRGDLPGDYADAITTATTRLSDTERAAFDGRWRQSLTKQALTMGLHEFRVHVRGLVDDVTRASELERHQRLHRQRTARIWTDPTDGMTKLFAAFDPETGARIRRTLDTTIDHLHRTARDDPHDTRTHQQVTADAVTDLITGARSSSSSRTELVVLVDVDTLTGHEPATGRCCETADGTPSPSKPSADWPAKRT